MPDSEVQPNETAAADEARDFVEFLDVRFDPVTMDGLTRWAIERNPQGRFGYVVTPNVDHIVRLARDRARLEPIYRDSDFTVCDSRVLSALARISGLRLPLAPGSDFTAQFFRDAVKPDDSVLIIGGEAPEIERLKSIYRLRNVTHQNPPMGLLDDPVAMDEVVQFVVGHPARYVFFALGSPQQEFIAHRIWDTGAATGLGFCIGASIDFLTGKSVRAPEIMRRWHLEWLHRLMQEPGRLWRRYLVDDLAIFAIYWRWRREHRSQ